MDGNYDSIPSGLFTVLSNLTSLTVLGLDGSYDSIPSGLFITLTSLEVIIISSTHASFTSSLLTWGISNILQSRAFIECS